MLSGGYPRAELPAKTLLDPEQLSLPPEIPLDPPLLHVAASYCGPASTGEGLAHLATTGSANWLARLDRAFSRTRAGPWLLFGVDGICCLELGFCDPGVDTWLSARGFFAVLSGTKLLGTPRFALTAFVAPLAHPARVASELASHWQYKGGGFARCAGYSGIAVVNYFSAWPILGLLTSAGLPAARVSLPKLGDYACVTSIPTAATCPSFSFISLVIAKNLFGVAYADDCLGGYRAPRFCTAGECRSSGVSSVKSMTSRKWEELAFYRP